MGPDTQTIEQIEEALQLGERIAQQLEPRRRRFNRALHDLGFLAIVGRDWVSTESGDISFRDLSPEAFRALVNRIEQLAEVAEGWRPRRAVDEIAEAAESDALAITEQYEQLELDLQPGTVRPTIWGAR
jgi:hypothetical protein